MTRGESYGFTDEEMGLTSVVNLVMMIQGLSGPDEDSSWATYLRCVSVMPGARLKPTHPLCLPLGFPTDGPPQPLTLETVESMERRFATLRSIWDRLEESMAGSDEPDAALINELGPEALAAVRGLGDDVEAERFQTGEHYVLGLKLRAAIPPESVGGAQLIQILDKMEQLRESDMPKAGQIPVFTARLIYRLPRDHGFRIRSHEDHEELTRIRERIEGRFVELFPGNHAVVELRDSDGATVIWGQVVGPTYEEEQKKMEEWRRKAKETS